MEKLLSNKTILITWASWDIWIQTALDCYHQWAKVILFAYRNKQKLIEIFKKYDQKRVLIYSCNATDEVAVSRIFKKLEKQWILLDGLFNNIGDLIDRKYIAESEWWLFESSFNVNVKSAYLFSKYSLNIFNKHASIVMMSSMTARWWNGDRSAHYWMSKWAITGLAKSMATEFSRRYGIRVNVVCPWYIKWSFHDKYTKKQVELEHARNNPLLRVWVPKDVSSVVIFLLSDMSTYVNWATIDINGWSFIC